MKTISKTRLITYTAVCIALCFLLPRALDFWQPVKKAISPVHIPVYLCGFMCGPIYGAICGISGALINCFVMGFNPSTLTMFFELTAYGLFSGLALKLIKTRNAFADYFIALIIAMLLGRVVGGVVRVLFPAIFAKGGVYSIAIFLTDYFVNSVIAIAVHLALVPTLVFAISRAGFLAERYPKRSD